MPDIPTPWHHTGAQTSGDATTGAPLTSPAVDLPTVPFTPNPQPTADTPWQPPQWRNPNLGGGYPAALDDSRREIVIPASDGPVTIAYGRVRVAPVVELLHTHLGNLDYAVLVWCLGEIEEIEEISFGADAGFDSNGNGLDEPLILASYTGSLSQTAYSSLTSMSSLEDGWPFALPGKAYSVVRATQGQDISLLNSARAVVKGLKVYDPRTSATTAAADRIYSRNPVLLAGTLFAAEWGMGAGYDAVDWDRLEDAADYCDVDVSGEPRFAVDVWSRQGMSLKTWLNTLALHCRGYWGRSNGLWYFDVRRPASSTFVFSDRLSRPTIAPESVRVTTRSRTKEPSSLVVDWLDTDSWQMGVPVTVPNPRPTFGLREARVQLPWCTSRSMARRIGVYELGQRTRNPAHVTWTAPDAAQAVQVGDVVTLDVDTLLDEVEVEVEQVKRDGGALQFVGTGYSSSKFGDVSEVPDTPPGWTPPGMGAPPDLPTSLVQTFVEQGNWDAHNLIPDEDDLETDWTENGVTASFDTGGTNITGSALGGELLYEFDPGSSDTVLITTVIKSSDLDTRWNLGYDDGGAAPVEEIPLQTAAPATALRRHVLTADVSATPLGPHTVYLENLPTSAGEEIKAFKTRVVPYVFRPGLALGERYTWVEHANAADTVARYEVVRQFADGSVTVLASAPQGRTSLYATTYSLGAIWGGASSALLNGSQIRFRVVGRRGRMAYMEPTEYGFGRQISGDVSGDLRDFDTSARATGKVPVWNATTEAHEYADVYTESEVDTLLGGKVSDTGDTMTGNLRFGNNIGVTGNETGGAERSILRVNASNQVSVGNASNALRLLGSETRPKYAGGDLALKSDSDAAIQKALVTTKGDLIAATAASTPARLAIGATDGYPLVVASAQAAGMQWARMALSALADQAQATVVGRASGAGTGAPSALTAAQLSTILGLGTLATMSSVGSAQIDANAVANSDLADMADGTVKLRQKGGGSGDPIDGGASDIIGILAGSASYSGDTETGLRLLVCDNSGAGVGYVDIDIRGGVVTSATYHAGFSS